MCEKQGLSQSGQAWPVMVSVDCFRESKFHQDNLYRGLQSSSHTLGYSSGLFYLARRLKSRRALDVVRVDRRKPVLYLRSFSFDGLNAFQGKYIIATEESKMVWALERIGPVLAIGKPGENLAHLGATRMYVDHVDWQTTVLLLMLSAQIVVIRVGGGIRLAFVGSSHAPERSCPPIKLYCCSPKSIRELPTQGFGSSPEIP